MSAAGEQAFREALTFTLAREGVDLANGDIGYVDDPDDPGGSTAYGITQGTFDAWRRSRNLETAPVREISVAEVNAIYQRNYWHDGRCDLFADERPKLALAHFDAAVNLGLVQAAKLLQRGLGVTDDGVIGPLTIAAAQTCDELATIGRELVERATVYHAIVDRRPASQKFLVGWLARCRWVARQCGVSIDPSYEKLT